MKIRGRQISNWWLLLFGALLLLASPLLLMGFFMSNNLAGAIFGPPAIWNRPSKPPSTGDIAGSYRESERHWQDHATTTRATLSLNSDGTMTVTNLPDSNGETGCILSGKGTWSEPDGESKVVLFIQQNDSVATCKTGGYGSFEIAGHSKPYSLYWVLGDPDSGEGVWLKSDQ
jgi:hypothetical protein